MRRVAAELAVTLATLAAVTAWMELRDPLSRTRILLAEGWESVREWSIRYRADRLIETLERGTDEG